MKALETFHHPIYKHNCAQAVAFRWQERLERGAVDLYARYGGGKAPNGMCGALFAALNACPEQAENIQKEFVQKAGASKCAEIKGMCKTPCAICVDTADELLEKYAK